MTAVKFRPIEKELSNYMNIANQLFRTEAVHFPSYKMTSPTVNVRETEANYELELVAAGLTKADFDIKIEKNVLTVSFEKTATQEDEEGGKYIRKEFSTQSFKRSFTLPETVNKDEISGKYEAGILFLTLPKKEVAPAKVISIL